MYLVFDIIKGYRLLEILNEKVEKLGYFYYSV